VLQVLASRRLLTAVLDADESFLLQKMFSDNIGGQLWCSLTTVLNCG
jgi:hypothetical protein